MKTKVYIGMVLTATCIVMILPGCQAPKAVYEWGDGRRATVEGVNRVTFSEHDQNGLSVVTGNGEQPRNEPAPPDKNSGREGVDISAHTELQRAIAKLEKSAQQARMELAVARENRDRLLAELKVEAGRLHEHQDQRRAEEDALKEGRAANARVLAELATRRTELAHVEQAVATRRDELSQVETRIAELEAERKRRRQVLVELQNVQDGTAADAEQRLSSLNHAIREAEQTLTQKRKHSERLDAAAAEINQGIAAGQKTLVDIEAEVKVKSEALAAICRELDRVSAGADVGGDRRFQVSYLLASAGGILLIAGVLIVLALKRHRPRESKLVLGWRNGTTSTPQQTCFRFNPRIEELRLTGSGPELAPIGEDSEGVRLRVRGGRLRLIGDEAGLTIKHNGEAAAPPVVLRVGDELTVGNGNGDGLRIVVRDFERVAESEEVEELKAAVEATAAS